MTKHKCKKLSKGHYLYRGFQVNCVGYNIPERRWWEAVDEHGCGFAHSYTLKEAKAEIDRELEEHKK